MRLTEIARAMEYRAKTHQIAERELSGGLSLKLVIVGGHKILTLSRPAVLPSIVEIGVCRQVFDVPDDAMPTMTNTEITYRWPS